MEPIVSERASSSPAPVVDGMGIIGKPVESFRVYGEGSNREDKVTRHYTLMRTNQTLAFVEKMEAKVSGWVVRVPSSIAVACVHGGCAPQPMLRIVCVLYRCFVSPLCVGPLGGVARGVPTVPQVRPR